MGKKGLGIYIKTLFAQGWARTGANNIQEMRAHGMEGLVCVTKNVGMVAGDTVRFVQTILPGASCLYTTGQGVPHHDMNGL